MEYQGGYTEEVLNEQVNNVFGEEMVDRLSDADKAQFLDFSEYVVALHALAAKNTNTGTIDLAAYREDLNEYDLRVQEFHENVTLLADDPHSPNIGALFGPCRHVSPHFMIFENAKLRLLFAVMLKLYYSYCKVELGVKPTGFLVDGTEQI